MVKVTLDAETFKALASATRLTVLRALDERRKTLTELAKDLDLNKATVHEHLALLSSAGLVKKCDDEGRKWIYYELTWRGEKILHPQETTTFNVLLGLGVAAAGGGIAMLGRTLGWWLQARQQEADFVDDGGASGTMMADDSARFMMASNSTFADEDAAPASLAAEENYDWSGNETAPAPAGPDGNATMSQEPDEPAMMFEHEPGQPDDFAYSDLQDADGSALEADGQDAAMADDSDGAWYDLDGDGLVSFALLACSLLFVLLAWVVRSKLRPKPGIEPVGEPDGEA